MPDTAPRGAPFLRPASGAGQPVAPANSGVHPTRGLPWRAAQWRIGPPIDQNGPKRARPPARQGVDRVDIFLQQLINGITLGSVYALVALGYTMVYGIIEIGRAAWR